MGNEVDHTPQNPPASDSALPDDEAGSLVEFMRQRDVACPSCAYNLRNLTAITCPECGTALVLGVHRAEPFFAAWIVATIAMAIAGAPGIVFVALIARLGLSLVFQNDFRMAGWLVSTAVIPVSLLLVRFRLAFLRLERRTQIWLAALSVVFTFAIYVVLVLLR